ncbi:MAG: hypothetical protein HeimC3_07480 [Candidatus Heimdallarchaeota archaeon LC_3]|nr:MAG: hypothetical protein HeimC3_07480 [Candidatus Heimdallarchaeota archaeon LC_3]
MNYMFDDDLRKFLGDDFALLNKPAIYLTKEEKWKILQAILFMFGAETEDNKIIVYESEDNEEKINQMKASIENMLKTTVEAKFDKETNRWILESTEFS